MLITEPKRVCDVFGQLKEVELYKIKITHVNDDGTEDMIIAHQVDLCPRGLMRLKHLVETGVTSATRKKKDEATVEAEEGSAS